MAYDPNLNKSFLELKSEIILMLEKYDTQKKDYLSNYLYFASFPIFSFIESVIILCNANKAHVAKVLLRSLFEIHINVVYHVTSQSNHTLALAAKSSFDEKLKSIAGIKELIERHPNLLSDDSDNLFSLEWLLEAERWSNENVKAILKGNSLKETDQDLDLKSKTLRCDKLYIKAANDNPKLENGHFERMYNVIYRQLSTTAHLNIEGIQTFVDKDPSGRYMFEDGDDGGFISGQAVEIGVAFVKDLYECNVLIGKRIEALTQVEKLLKN